MKRVLTALATISIVLALTLFAPDWAFAVSVGLISALAAEEFMGLGTARRMDRPGVWFVVPVGMVGASFIGGAEWVLTSLALSALLLLTVTMFSGSLNTMLARSAIGLGAVLYCGFTLGFLVLLPRELVLLLVAIIGVGDSAAYYGGRALAVTRWLRKSVRRKLWKARLPDWPAACWSAELQEYFFSVNRG